MITFFGFPLSALPFALNLVGAMLLAPCFPAETQQSRIYKVGEIAFRSASVPAPGASYSAENCVSSATLTARISSSKPALQMVSSTGSPLQLKSWLVSKST
jgi:hypothetical protein